jgi:hypothetical protein
MHALADYEFSQERYTRMRREAEMARLAKMLRANRKARPADLLARTTLRWELSRYAGLLGKRLGNND